MAAKPMPLDVLIINPNTSTHMTDALAPAVESMQSHPTVQFTYFTSPSPGIPSINSPDDAAESAKICLPALKPLIHKYDAFLVACYSQHPLVHQLRQECDAVTAQELATNGGGNDPTSPPPRRRYVTGIFEASVSASLNLTASHGPDAGFGIVSTGKIWETALASASLDFLGADTKSRRFLGCETTGLNASELHDMPAPEVRRRMMEATKRLVGRGKDTGVALRAVCLGCAGMVGLEEAVRAALVEGMGGQEGMKVAVVDGVKAGVSELVMLCRGEF